MKLSRQIWWISGMSKIIPKNLVDIRHEQNNFDNSGGYHYQVTEQGADIGGSLWLSQPFNSDEETQNFKPFQISELLLHRKHISPPCQELRLIQKKENQHMCLGTDVNNLSR